MAASSVASHHITQDASMDAAAANCIGLQSKIAAVSNPTVAESLVKCCTEVQGINDDVGVRLLRVVGDLVQAIGKNKTGDPVSEIKESSILTRASKISVANPKGKFDVLFTEETLALKNPKHLLQLKYADIKSVYIMDGLPAERTGKVYMVLHFKPSCTVDYGKRKLDNFTLELPEKDKLDCACPAAILCKEGPERTQGSAAVVICTVLGQLGVKSFAAPDKSIYNGRGASKCIGALLKFNQGYLFPLRNAVLFIGSQCFVLSHDAVLGVNMVGAESERRTFDLVFHGHTGEVLQELTQLDMRDLAAWGDYMSQTGLKRVADEDPTAAAPQGRTSAAAAPSGAPLDPPQHPDSARNDASAGLSTIEAEEFGDDDDEDEDEDFDVHAEENDSDGDEEATDDHYGGGGGGGARPSSAAAPSRKRAAPEGGHAGAGCSRMVTEGGKGVATGAPKRKRLRSAGHTEALELPDDIIAAEMGALEDVEGIYDSDDDLDYDDGED